MHERLSPSPLQQGSSIYREIQQFNMLTLMKTCGLMQRSAFVE
jgi:hypothetical protein